MAVLNSLNISASGMTAQKLRLDIISQNIANVNTTRDENGDVYRRKVVLFQENNAGTGTFKNALTNASSSYGRGVIVSGIAEDHVTALKKVYDPSHPDADEDGYVTYPNIDTVTEMTNMIDATRSYEANVTAFNATKNMLLKGLEMGQ